MSAAVTTHSIRCARLFDGERMMRDVLLSWDGDRIVGLLADAPSGTAVDHALPESWVVAPGLIDLQVNGGGGVMFNDDVSAHGAACIANAHARTGTTGLLLTLITDVRTKIGAAQMGVRQARAAGVPGVLGLHLEGPFLQQSRRGIHRAEFIVEMSDSDVAEIAAIAETMPCLLTLAPECVRPHDIYRLSKAGVKVFGGHTDASFEQMSQAVQQGLCGVTHLFNAMSQVTAREAGVVGAALLDPLLWAGVILDGHHVDAATAAIAWRMRGHERTLLVSDAMAPAGTGQTEFLLQGQRIHVRNGRCENDAGTLAGAAICLADAVRIGVQRYGLSIEHALYCATAAPARLLGLDRSIGRIRPGSMADLTVFDADLVVQGVVQQGAWLRPLGEAGGV